VLFTVGSFLVTVLNALIGVAVLLILTIAVGLAARFMQGRARRRLSAQIVGPELVGEDALGARATILQFSTDFCTRCPEVHRDLGDVADARVGVTHLDVDLTHRPDLAKRFHVLQTPTTLILDQDGVVTGRFGGVPHRNVVEFELDRVINDEPATV